MIRTEIIKQIFDGNNVYREGHKVEITMKDEYVRGCNGRKKNYTGTIRTITDDVFFLSYDNVTMPVAVCEIENIKKI